MTNDPRQVKNHRQARIQNRRSVFSNCKRGRLRLMTTSCCRRHRFSATRYALGLKKATIARTAHRNNKPSRFSYPQRKSSIPSLFRKAPRIQLLRPTTLASVRVCLLITRSGAQRPFNAKISPTNPGDRHAMSQSGPESPRQPNVPSFTASERCYPGNLG